MPRGQYQRESKTATTGTETAVVSTGIRATTFTSITGWKKLDDSEQKAVLHESQKLATAMYHFGQARLAIGEHLVKLQAILEPKNLFTKFLSRFRFSKKTAYRYIAGYNNAKSRLPQVVLKAAMTRGVDLIGDSETKPLGVYTAAAEKLPLPSEPTEAQAVEYIDQLEATRKQMRQEMVAGVQSLPVGDRNVLLRECVRFVSTRYKRLPANKNLRDKWARELVGMLMQDMGITQATTFQPIAIPDDFIAHRGRPSQKTATA